MKPQNLILLALAGVGVYLFYNKMNKKTLPTASAIKKDINKDIEKFASSFENIKQGNEEDFSTIS
jgi:hypothetical protein